MDKVYLRAKLRILERKILLVDCFDSFTFNLKHYLEQFCHTTVSRIDELDLDHILNYDAIVLSPGPKLPQDYPKLKEIIEICSQEIPILGVCLGMQALGEFFGGSIIQLQQVKHGLSEPLIKTKIEHSIFNEMGDDILVARYHSWVIESNLKFSQYFEITSVDTDQEIMSIKHKTLPISGVQFHPESIMTPKGLKLIENWVSTI